MKMSKVWLIANLGVFTLSVVWFFNDRTIEPVIVGILALASSWMQFFSDENQKGNMSIKAGKKSKNYQSAGDINIKNEQ